MSRRVRESFFWHAANRASRRLNRAWRKSRILGAFRAWGNAAERFPNGRFAFLREPPVAGENWQTRWRRSVMRIRENSFFLHFLDELRGKVLRLPLWMPGFFSLLSVLFCAVCSVFFGMPLSASGWGVLSIFASVSLVLVTSRQSLSKALAGSMLARFFFCRICDCGEDAFGTGEEGKVLGAPVLLPLAALVGGSMAVIGPFRFVGVALMLLLLLFLFSFPEWCWILMIFVFPFLHLLPHATGGILVLSCVLLFSWGFKAACGRRDISPEINDLPVLLFCLLLFLGGVVSKGRVEEGIVAALLTATYFPVRRMLAQERCRRRTQIGMQISALATAVVGILQYFLTDLPVMWVDVNRFSDLGGRVTSFFGNPNILAIYLLFSLPHALIGLCDRLERRGWRILFGVSAVLQLVCLTLTWSRGAWLGAILQCAMLLLFYNRKTRAVALLSPIPLAFALPFLPDNVLKRFSSIGALSESSIRYRLYTWQGVGRMLAAYPHGIGVGESAFVAVYPHYAVSGTERVMHAHNVFLTVGIELGIMGLLVFGVILILPFLRAVANGRINGGLLALAGVAVMGLFDHLWYDRGMLMLFFASLAMSYTRGEREWNKTING